MTSFMSVLNMVHTFYLETRGLGIVKMNHIFLQKENYYHMKSKRKQCLRKKWNKIKTKMMNIHKDMRITDGKFQTNNKLFVTVNPKNACKLEFMIIYGYHLLINHSQML